jgi:hypothetical protein
VKSHQAATSGYDEWPTAPIIFGNRRICPKPAQNIALANTFLLSAMADGRAGITSSCSLRSCGSTGESLTEVSLERALMT